MNELSNRLLTGVSQNLANFYKNLKTDGSTYTIDQLDRKIFYVFEYSKSKKSTNKKLMLLKK